MHQQHTCLTCGLAFAKRRRTKRRFCSIDCYRARARNNVVLSADGLTAQIALCANDGMIRAYATIDAADAVWAGQWNWCWSHGYAIRGGSIRLHRSLLGLMTGDGIRVDHIDRDRLNNRRSNLRIVTHAGNMQNLGSQKGATSAYRGVSWNARDRRWAAQLVVDGKHYWLGYFTDEREAARVAREARRRLMPYAVD